METEPFDPTPLVALARDQHPDLPWLAEALARCTAGRRESRAYVRFVEPYSPEWVFQENVIGVTQLRWPRGQIGLRRPLSTLAPGASCAGSEPESPL